jgi:hypothetical protein
METYRQVIRTLLPEEYAKRAIANCDKALLDTPFKEPKKSGILAVSFTWGETPEGHEFWSRVNYFCNNSLPPIPE